MRNSFIFFFLVALPVFAIAQPMNSYQDSLRAFQHKYVTEHEVVKGRDTSYLSFFPVNKKYRVVAKFEKLKATPAFSIPTSGGASAQYFKYGKLTFKINDTIHHLYLYQSERLMSMEKYKDYLFLPFTDFTNAIESYSGGRYIDVTTGEISNNTLVLDFNKAYNPYCAYGKGYQCPLPPKESNLNTAIPAGEKSFGKPVH